MAKKLRSLLAEIDKKFKESEEVSAQSYLSLAQHFKKQKNTKTDL